MHPTLVFADRVHSPAEMAEATARVSGGLAALGLREGDTVAVMLRNGPAYLSVLSACRQAGLYLVSVNWHFKAAEAGWLLSDSGARLLIVNDDLLPQVASGIPTA